MWCFHRRSFSTAVCCVLWAGRQTYLNAMTYPDRTVYPVASPNLTDFYNLVDVYLDAVLHPRLEPTVFQQVIAIIRLYWSSDMSRELFGCCMCMGQQEGWHHEVHIDHSGSGPKDPSAATLKYKGVVFNEMKGVYSSPDALHNMALQSALYPDTIYRHSSGGDPPHIPSLTYKQFKDFHSSFYHPSNAVAYFYGDDDVTRRLDKLHEYFKDYSHKPASDIVTPQVSFERSGDL